MYGAMGSSLLKAGVEGKSYTYLVLSESGFLWCGVVLKPFPSSTNSLRDDGHLMEGGAVTLSEANGER